MAQVGGLITSWASKSWASETLRCDASLWAAEQLLISPGNVSALPVAGEMETFLLGLTHMSDTEVSDQLVHARVRMTFLAWLSLWLLDACFV